MAKTVYQQIEIAPNRVVVCRQKVVRGVFGGDEVLVPVMSFDSAHAAQLWVSGQYELAARGSMAGFD